MSKSPQKPKPKPKGAANTDQVRDELFEMLHKITAESPKVEAAAAAPPSEITFEQLLAIEKAEREGTWRVWEEAGRDAEGKPRAEVLVANLSSAIERKAELISAWMQENGVAEEKDVPREVHLQTWRVAQYGTLCKGWRGPFFAGAEWTLANFLALYDTTRFRTFLKVESIRRLELRDVVETAVGKA